MPTPFLHVPLAYRVAYRVGIERTGAFLFGSMAPDIAWWLRRPRSETHFWTLDDDVSGALRLVETHPALAGPHLSADERSFLAGYLCHLVTDEQWKLCIWRPYFGRFSPFGGSGEAIALQSALRDVLDARELHAPRGFAALANQLTVECALRPDLLPFVETDALERYRASFVARAREAPPSAAAPIHDRATRYVGDEAIAGFRRRALEESVALVADYLAGRPLRPPLGTEDPRATSAT